MIWPQSGHFSKQSQTQNAPSRLAGLVHDLVALLIHSHLLNILYKNRRSVLQAPNNLNAIELVDLDCPKVEFATIEPNIEFAFIVALITNLQRTIFQLEASKIKSGA